MRLALIHALRHSPPPIEEKQAKTSKLFQVCFSNILASCLFVDYGI
jgi:hypothetical protein